MDVNISPNYSAIRASQRAIPRMIPYIADFVGRPAAATVVTSGHDLRELEQPLVFYFSPVDYQDEGKQNTAIDKFVASINPRSSFSRWNGSVLVLKYGDDRRTTFTDVDQSDLYDIWAFFKFR